MATPPRTALRPTDYAVDENGCWIWQLWTDRDGYGSLRANNVFWRAHRFSWFLANGPIPEGMEIDHLCFVPSCINPEHLRVVTPLENMRNHRAAYKTHCLHGHEFTPENTRRGTRKDGRTYRICATCKRRGVRERQRARGVTA